ncbi:MAG: YjbQ family protein [Armatimonadetes bacterium]|nr:YjbQ family protein [Armatimonadota bacterium]
MVHTSRVDLQTKGNDDIIDITPQIQQSVLESGLINGVVVAFVIGSTAALTTIEYEPGLVADLPNALERIAPRNAEYAHEARWSDDNGHSHVRAALIGPTITVPFVDGNLALGAWQQIVLIDFDTRPRKREVVVQILGD